MRDPYGEQADCGFRDSSIAREPLAHGAGSNPKGVSRPCLREPKAV